VDKIIWQIEALHARPCRGPIPIVRDLRHEDVQTFKQGKEMSTGQKRRKIRQVEDPPKPASSRASGKMTINDIARICGVSKKTVSRVINRSPFVRGATRDEIERTIAETGFVPDPQARALARQKSHLIGLVYDNPSPQYVVNIQRGILDAFEGTDFQLVLNPCDRTAPDYLDRVRAFVVGQRPFGLIMPPSVSEDVALAAMLTELKVDFVRIAAVSLDSPERMLVTGDREGGALAAAHLIKLGHREIAHIHGPLSFRSTHERKEGFLSVLRSHGIEVRPEMVVEGAYTFESGVTATQALLQNRLRPTAIFGGNDEMATGAYVALRKAGFQLPDDMSIIGYDDSPIAGRLWPALTTVRLPVRDMGRAAANMLMALGENRAEALQNSFSPELIVRDSTLTLVK
jgi:LacI family transcriptional regulator